MRTMLLAFLATAIIAVGANYILKDVGFSAADKSTGPDVRLDG